MSEWLSQKFWPACLRAVISPYFWAGVFITIIIMLLARTAEASPCPHPVRHAAPKWEFVRMHPCPANGRRTIHCHGYVIDHVVPLCACGPDAAGNMQWQSIADAKRKDRLEWRQCHG